MTTEPKRIRTRSSTRNSKKAIIEKEIEPEIPVEKITTIEKEETGVKLSINCFPKQLENILFIGFLVALSVLTYKANVVYLFVALILVELFLLFQ